jgi:hypothetical protein
MTRVDADTKVSQLIPSVELKGSRAERLATLDALIARLMKLRQSLSGASLPPGNHERTSAYVAAPSWPWFICGVLAGVLMLLLAFSARDRGETSIVPALPAVNAFR